MSQSSIIALDIGTKRIGVARANVETGFASPLTTLNNTETILAQLQELLSVEGAVKVVVGLPRSLGGNETEQTKYTRSFIQQLSEVTDLPIETQDEALTSKMAEDELYSKKVDFKKGDVDALAATYILEDYINGQGETHVS